MAVPKCGSTAMRAALAPAADICPTGGSAVKHLTMSKILERYEHLFSQDGYRPESFFRFAVLRDPVERLNSWYRYRIGNNPRSRIPPETSFREFWELQDFSTRTPDGRPNVQIDWMRDRTGHLLVDYIIPYEELETHFLRLSQEIGGFAHLRKQTVSRIPQHESPVPDALLPTLREFFREDYELRARLPEINAQGLAHLRQTRALAGG